MYGELVPLGGGDPIPLTKTTLMVGRRESCDIVLRFANISGNHCRLAVEQGYWYVQDLNSQNGTKVNGGSRITRKRLDPGDTLSIARHKYKVQYSPVELGATGPPPADEPEEVSDVMSKSLLERAGLKRQMDPSRRFNVMNDGPGQLRKKIDDD